MPTAASCAERGRGTLMPDAALRLAMVAGETSGDLLAGLLLKASKPCSAMRGPPMPTARVPGQRARMPLSSRPASRSPEASPATMARRSAAPGVRVPSSRSAHDAAVGTGQELEHELDVRSRCGHF